MSYRTPASHLSSSRLPWSQIKELFDGLWVELVDYEWDWNKAYPKLARVRNFADDRNTLLSRISISESIEDSLVILIGGANCVVEQDASAVAL